MFNLSDSVKFRLDAFREFVDTEVLPAEETYRKAANDPNATAEREEIEDRLRRSSRSGGYWNMFLDGPNGISNVEFAHFAEISGEAPTFGPLCLNCNPPNSVNMCMVAAVGNDEQLSFWLDRMKRGELSTAFAMTEPGVASSDANNISCSIVRDGDELVINGSKWYISGMAGDCDLFFVMGISDADAPRHSQHSIVGVPADLAGVEMVRSLPVFGYASDVAELRFSNVRVPVENVLGGIGNGFRVAQTRLASARLHHSMRLIGLAERALSITASWSKSRHVAGGSLARKDVFRAKMVESRLLVDQARLMTLAAANRVDCEGSQRARYDISAAKVVSTRMATQVLNFCVGAHGARGVSDETPLAEWLAQARSLEIADGPEEVHIELLARREFSV